MTNKHIIAGAAFLTLAGCTTAASPPSHVTMVQTATPSAEPGTTPYDPTVRAYPDETPHVIGGQTFYFNRYTPFDIR